MADAFKPASQPEVNRVQAKMRWAATRALSRNPVKEHSNRLTDQHCG